jgi:hypothetical protein
MSSRKAQAAMEYMMVAGFIGIVIIPAMFLFYSYAADTSKQIDQAQIEKFGREVIVAAETVHALGAPSRIVIEERLPPGVQSMGIAYDEGSGVYDLWIAAGSEQALTNYSFITSANIAGAFTSADIQPGLKRARLSAKTTAEGVPYTSFSLKPMCTLDSDCAAGEWCNQGDCYPETPEICIDDGECDPGEICVDGSCIPKPGPYYAFVSSLDTYNGNFGGLAGADAICDGLAGPAGLSGTYHAWLSTATVDAKDRIPDVEYKTTTEVTIANDKADLLDGSLISPIKFNENKGSENSRVWTGTLRSGLYDSNTGDCLGWSTSDISYESREGRSDWSTFRWTEYFTRRCNTGRAIYCFQVTP